MKEDRPRDCVTSRFRTKCCLTRKISFCLAPPLPSCSSSTNLSPTNLYPSIFPRHPLLPSLPIPPRLSSRRWYSVQPQHIVMLALPSPTLPPSRLQQAVTSVRRSVEISAEEVRDALAVNALSRPKGASPSWRGRAAGTEEGRGGVGGFASGRSLEGRRVSKHREAWGDGKGSGGGRRENLSHLWREGAARLAAESAESRLAVWRGREGERRREGLAGVGRGGGRHIKSDVPQRDCPQGQTESKLCSQLCCSEWQRHAS